jgi:hypothetical protein
MIRPPCLKFFVTRAAISSPFFVASTSSVVSKSATILVPGRNPVRLGIVEEACGGGLSLGRRSAKPAGDIAENSTGRANKKPKATAT